MGPFRDIRPKEHLCQTAERQVIAIKPPIRPKMAEDHHFELPRLCDVFRRAMPHIAEAILVPLGLFYAALLVLGPKGAICTALAWNLMALLRRLWRRERLPGVLLLGTVGFTARSAVALASSSSLFVYFLQPSLGAALLGGAFLLSVPLGCPLAEKLAHDFVPLPPSFFKRPKVRQLFVRISLLWALGEPGQCSWHARVAARPAHLYFPGRQNGPFVGAHRGWRRALVLVVPPWLAPQQRRGGRRRQ